MKVSLVQTNQPPPPGMFAILFVIFLGRPTPRQSWGFSKIHDFELDGFKVKPRGSIPFRGAPILKAIRTGNSWLSAKEANPQTELQDRFGSSQELDTVVEQEARAEASAKQAAHEAGEPDGFGGRLRAENTGSGP